MRENFKGRDDVVVKIRGKGVIAVQGLKGSRVQKFKGSTKVQGFKDSWGHGVELGDALIAGCVKRYDLWWMRRRWFRCVRNFSDMDLL